jgi:hypothetical protein
MTRDEILAMQPGFSLDELVAINVMGKENNKTVWGQKPFEPSRNISAAWEVQEKLQEHGGMVLGSYGSKSGARWFAVQTTVGSKEINVTCHTAPEAICKAALLAVMEVSR